MLHTCQVEAESEAGVARQRAVLRPAWHPRIADSSRAEDRCQQASMQLKRLSVESCRADGSRAATEWHVVGWRGIRSCGCARRRAAAHGAGIGAGTCRLQESW